MGLFKLEFTMCLGLLDISQDIGLCDFDGFKGVLRLYHLRLPGLSVLHDLLIRS